MMPGSVPSEDLLFVPNGTNSLPASCRMETVENCFGGHVGTRPFCIGGGGSVTVGMTSWSQKCGMLGRSTRFSLSLRILLF